MAIDFKLPPDVEEVRLRVRKFMDEEVRPAQDALHSDGADRRAFVEQIVKLREKATAKCLGNPPPPKEFAGLGPSTTAGRRVRHDGQESATKGSLRCVRSTILLDAEGHRVSLRWSFNASETDNAMLLDGRILNVAQLNADEWLFIIPKDAEPGPNSEQTQIRVFAKARGATKPGFLETRLDIFQIE